MTVTTTRGLVFVGFPLHPAGKPATARADHLKEFRLPLLFLQGTRDELADLQLIRETTSNLGERATLSIVDGADHAFHVLVKSGRTDAEVIQQLADNTVRWVKLQL